MMQVTGGRYWSWLHLFFIAGVVAVVVRIGLRIFLVSCEASTEGVSSFDGSSSMFPSQDHQNIGAFYLACENFARPSARVWLGNFFSRLNWNRWRLSKSSLYSLIWYQNLKFFTVSFDAFDSITVDSTLDLASPANLDSIFVLSLPILSSLVFFSL